MVARPSHGTEAQGKRFVLIAAAFNRALTQALVAGATETLTRHGAARRKIQVQWVPGTFELPVAAARAVDARPRPDAVIALGALVKGDTSQYEVLANAAAQGLTQVAVHAKIPVTYGVIVADSLAQARARAGLPAALGRRGTRGAAQAGGAVCNRGEEAALAALGVLRLFDRLRSPARKPVGRAGPARGAESHHLSRGQARGPKVVGSNR